MIKLRHFLKPFIAGLLLAIALLFIQALCELSLPNYMSDIVNTGIQQGGVQDSAPRALSQEGSTFIQTFMSDDERTLMEDNYRLAAGNDTDENGRPYADTWAKAAEENIYVLDPDISEETLAALDAAFGNATWTMVDLLKQVRSAREDGTLEDVIKEQITERVQAGEDMSAFADLPAASDFDEAAGGDSGSTDLQQLDFSKIYQFQSLLELLPANWFTSARATATSMDASLREQSGTMLAAGFYRELGRDMGEIEMSYILRIGMLMLLITVLSGAASILVGFLSSRIGAGVARDLRGAVFDKVSNFSHAEFDRFSTASLITRSTNDITVMQMLLTMGIRMICYAPIMGIGGVYMALSKSVSMSWIIAVAVLVLIGIAVVLLAIVMPKFKVMQKLIDRLNLVARETLNGLMVVRAFSRSSFETERFEQANRDLTATNLFVNRAMTFLMPVMMIFMNALTVLIIWVGAHQVAESQMQVGDMMAYMQYAMQIVMSFMFIAMMFVFIPRASVSAARINEVLSTESTIVDPREPKHLDLSQRGRVEFRDVSFRYAGAEQNALCDISFVAQPGQTTAFIGSTGSGKSTIVNLILRFYDATSGQVLVDGVDVRELAQTELRAQIGYVPQRSVLMAGTIGSNILYGVADDAAGAGVTGGAVEVTGAGAAQAEGATVPPRDMEKIAEVAQALDFIQEMDEGFDSPVAQGGSNVSGGQRQRLSIARALAVEPDIYLFDDSFSALDFTTDTALRRALRSHTDGATLIIIAQRVNTIMDAEQIIVIDDGRMVGKGTHKELLETCEAYREIASSQLSEKDLKGGGDQ
jgi:ATP-binding cassette subfamily B protein